MFFKKACSSWFTPIDANSCFAQVAKLIAEHRKVYVLHEHSVDSGSVEKEMGGALDACGVIHLPLSLFISLSEVERNNFCGAIVATYEAFTSAVVSQWLPQGWGALPLPVNPIVAIGLDAVSDARVSRVFLPLHVQSIEREWREIHSVSKTAWAWIAKNGGVDALVSRPCDEMYAAFYHHVKTIVGKEDDSLRSICYQSLYACIEASRDLVEGVHYTQVGHELMWAGKDGVFSSSNIKAPVMCAAIRARLNLPPQKVDSTPEVIDVHPFSLLRWWHGEVFGCSCSIDTRTPFSFKDDTIRVSDSLKGQNVFLQHFINRHKDKDIFVLVNDSDYMAGLSSLPVGICVLTHAAYMMMQIHSPSANPTICLQMPKSERALRELVGIFRLNSIPYQFALCGHDGRFGPNDLGWLSLTAQFSIAPASRGAQKVLSFWLDLWERAKDQSASQGDQYRLDRLKISVLSTAFRVVTAPTAGTDDNGQQLQGKAFELGLSHILPKVMERQKLTPHLLWALFLLKVQEELLMHRLGSSLLPVQLSLSSEKTSHDMEEMKVWKKLKLHHKS